MRRAALLAACAAACGVEVGEPGVWVPLDEIAPPYEAEVMAVPPSSPARSGRVIATDPVRVVTFNVEYGEDPEGLARAILGSDELASAGVLLLQEEEDHPDEGGSRAARLAELLDLGYVYAPARMKGDATHGLAILSAFPIEDARVMQLPEGLSRRIALAADIRVGDRTLHVIDLHLDTVLNITDRILQIRPAVLEAPDVVLVGGDVNTNDYLWTESVPNLPADVVADADQAPILDEYMRALGFDTPTALLGATEHKYLSEFRLDAIFTRGLRVTPGRVVREVDQSDHWPMYVDVELP